MPFATDRDLLIVEPSLFRDVSFLGQQIFRGTVRLDSGVLSIVAAPTDFTQSAVAPGHIIVVDERPYEILARTGASTLSVSLLRAAPDGNPILPANFIDRAGIITTFDPQIALVHDRMLRLLGLDAASAAADPTGLALTQDHITNPHDLRLAEALGALHVIYSAASAQQSADSPTARRAELYRRRHAEESRQVRIHLDIDGDGRPDVTRTLAVLHLVR